MFTTGVHTFLYSTVACYVAALIFNIFKVRRVDTGLLITGFALQSLYLLGRGWLGDVFIPNPIFEGPFFLPWCLSVIPLVQALKKPDSNWGLTLFLAIVFTILSALYAKGMIPPTPKKLSIWALLFFMSESAAHALFYTGALYGFLSIIGKDKVNGFHSCIVWGFIAYTVAQVTGAVWCFVGWGNTFNWGARHLGSATIWTFYAGALHLKFIPGWKKRSALFALAGAVLVFILSYSSYLREMSFLRIGG
jgi:hypothetical protein